MLPPRVIPVLTLDRERLIKTLNFSDPRYIGDPINAVRIFNEKEVDELILLDITATRDGRTPDVEFIGRIGSEAFMPFAYGGGIQSTVEIRAIFRAGAEKVTLNTSALMNPVLIREATAIFGGQSIVGAVDIRWDAVGKEYRVCLDNGKKMLPGSALDYILRMVDLGVGEIFLNSADRDGAMQGYDEILIHRVAEAIPVPLIACGGAGGVEDFSRAVAAGASAAAAGACFLFCGSRNAILITYPDRQELDSVFYAYASKTK